MICSCCKTDNPQNSVYCCSCGEKIAPPRLTISSFFQRFLAEFLDYDNKLLKTFRHLFSKPEVVIESYVKGFRKQYVNVLTYFSLSLSLLAIQVFFIKTFFPDVLNSALQSNNQVAIQGQEVMMKLFDFQGLLTIVFTPVAALMSWISFADKKYNVAEHVVLNIYPTAQYSIVWFLSSAVLLGLGMDYQTGGMISFIFLFFYMIYIFKRVFQLSWLAILGRTLIYYLLYFIVYGVFFLILGVLIGIYMGATGKI